MIFAFKENCMNLKRISLVLFLVFFAIIVFAQKRDLYKLHGTIINVQGEALSDAQIQLISRNLRTFSNEEGEFSVPISSGDTLFFTHIGYNHLLVIIPDTLKTAEINRLFILQKSEYQLEEVVIKSWPDTYEDFKEAFIDLKLEDEKNNLKEIQALPGMGKIKEDNHIVVPRASIINPISLIYNAFSKRVKSIKTLKKLQENIPEEDEIDEKFSVDLVSKITGITDKEILRDLTNYCPPRRDFIKNATDYDIYIYIKDCYKAFLEDHPNMEIK